MWPHRLKPTRLHRPWDSPGKNTGVGCHFLLQCMKVKRESEVAQLCPTLSNPMDYSPPVSSVHGIFQARVLEWVAIAFSSPSKYYGSAKGLLYREYFDPLFHILLKYTFYWRGDTLYFMDISFICFLLGYSFLFLLFLFVCFGVLSFVFLRKKGRQELSIMFVLASWRIFFFVFSDYTLKKNH